MLQNKPNNHNNVDCILRKIIIETTDRDCVKDDISAYSARFKNIAVFHDSVNKNNYEYTQHRYDMDIWYIMVVYVCFI